MKVASLKGHRRRVRWSLVVLLEIAVFLGACLRVPPPVSEPMVALILEDQDIRPATNREAIRKLGFVPVLPEVLLPGTSPDPMISVYLKKGTNPWMDARYQSKNTGEFGILIEEKPASNSNITWSGYSQIDIDGTTVSHIFNIGLSPTGPTPGFEAHWYDRVVEYHLKIGWLGTAGGGSALEEERVQASLAIVRSMIQAANRP